MESSGQLYFDFEPRGAVPSANARRTSAWMSTDMPSTTHARDGGTRSDHLGSAHLSRLEGGRIDAVGDCGVDANASAITSRCWRRRWARDPHLGGDSDAQRGVSRLVLTRKELDECAGRGGQRGSARSPGCGWYELVAKTAAKIVLQMTGPPPCAPRWATAMPITARSLGVEALTATVVDTHGSVVSPKNSGLGSPREGRESSSSQRHPSLMRVLDGWWGRGVVGPGPLKMSESLMCWTVASRSLGPVDGTGRSSSLTSSMKADRGQPDSTGRSTGSSWTSSQCGVQCSGRRIRR